MPLNAAVIACSLAAMLISFWHRNDIPAGLDLLPAVREEPRQRVTTAAGFAVRYNDTDYQISPEYDYELTGLVVSFRHHDGDSRMHRQAGDHINMLDLCVIWGSNAEHPDINQLDFWNGIFTCNVQTRDNAAWAAFDVSKLSNNHLISDDPAIREQVRGVAIGDQIRVSGQLASYTGPGGRRGTSTTRTDTGDGACETIYVRSFEILEPAKNRWRQAMYAAFALFTGSLVCHFRRPYRPYRESRQPSAAAPFTE